MVSIEDGRESGGWLARLGSRDDGRANEPYLATKRGQAEHASTRLCKAVEDRQACSGISRL